MDRDQILRICTKYGCVLKQLSTFHHRITRPGYHNYIDVWTNGTMFASWESQSRPRNKGQLKNLIIKGFVTNATKIKRVSDMEPFTQKPLTRSREYRIGIIAKLFTN